MFGFYLKKLCLGQVYNIQLFHHYFLRRVSFLYQIAFTFGEKQFIYVGLFYSTDICICFYATTTLPFDYC